MNIPIEKVIKLLGGATSKEIEKLKNSHEKQLNILKTANEMLKSKGELVLYFSEDDLEDFFCVEEFIDPATFQRFKSRGMDPLQIMDVRILWTAVATRKYFDKPMTINNYKWSGRFKYRGYRPVSYKRGAVDSQHRQGRGLDSDFKGISAAEVRKEIKTHPKAPAFKYITTIEEKLKGKPINWNHWDCRNRDMSKGITFINA